MAYTSTRVIRRFEMTNPKKVVNGCPASGMLFSLIADGQQYLFGNDMPMTNMFSGRGIANKNSIQATGTTVKTVYGRVLMPPHSSHCEFWFSCGADSSDDDDSTVGYPYVSVASSGTGGETRTLYAVPVMSDDDTSGAVYDYGTDDLAMYATYWVGLFGQASDPAVSVYDVQAVLMLDPVVTVWTEVPVQIDWRASSNAAGKLTMNAIYYRVVPPAIYTF